MHRIVCANREDVENAVFSAHEVFRAGVWSKAPAGHRAAVLSNLARDLEARVPDLAKMETLQTGRAIREMKTQVRSCFRAVCYPRAQVRGLTFGGGRVEVAREVA